MNSVTANSATSTVPMIAGELTTFTFGEKEIRVINKGGEPWFVAKDVCDALSLTNSRKALTALDKDEKGVTLTYTLGGNQEVATVSESGMYTLVLRCRDAIKPGSVPHKFRKWVTAEVLPSIRKNGVYSKTKKALLGKITFEQQEAIKQLVMNRGKALPKDRQAKAMITMWSALKSHFGVSYKEIEESQFAEALSLAARVPLEGELMPPVFLPTPEPSVDLSMEIHNIGIACGHIEYIWRVWGSELYPALKAVRSPLAYELMDRIRDSCAIVNTVRRGLERNRG